MSLSLFSAAPCPHAQSSCRISWRRTWAKAQHILVPSPGGTFLLLLYPWVCPTERTLWVNCICTSTACSHTFKHANGLVAWEFHSTSSMHCVFILQDLLDVNTLELGRQLTLAYSGILREFRVSSEACLYLYTVQYLPNIWSICFSLWSIYYMK